jgi:O-antigen/teichoic acid export membrane protein
MYSLPSTLIDTLVANLPVPFLINLYGVEAGGYFALVQRVLAVPISLIATSVADSFHGSLAICARESPGKMLGLFKRTSLWLFIIGLIPFLIVVLFGKSLFKIILGYEWGLAGMLAVISAPWFLAQFVVSPLSRLVLVLRGQELKLAYDILTLAGMLIVVMLASQRHFSLVRTVWAFSWINVVAYIIYYIALVHIVSRSSSLKACPEQ